jgi:hypothetical protein
MTESNLHEQKKVKNYLLMGILFTIVIFTFCLAMVKIEANYKILSSTPEKNNGK